MRLRPNAAVQKVEVPNFVILWPDCWALLGTIPRISPLDRIPQGVSSAAWNVLCPC